MRDREIRSNAGAIAWEVAIREPTPVLRPHVQRLQGYVERSAMPLARRELPSPNIVMIIELVPAIRVYEAGQDQRWSSYSGGFVAGLDDRWTLTEHDGHQRGIQLDLGPIAARHLFGLPMSELAGRVIGLDDLLPASERGLAERLAELPSWAARFDAVEQLVGRRIASSNAATGVVPWALEQLARGDLSVRELATETGYSQKHLISLFREHVGIPPKRWARLARFERLQHELRRGTTKPWAELAVELGYHDQSHLARDVRRFADRTPSQLRADIRGTGYPVPKPG